MREHRIGARVRIHTLDKSSPFSMVLGTVIKDWNGKVNRWAFSGRARVKLDHPSGDPKSYFGTTTHVGTSLGMLEEVNL